MARSRSKDVDEVNRFFEHLGKADANWFFDDSHLALLKRKAADVAARATALSAHETLTIAVRATVVLIALGEQPPLEVLARGFMSESRFDVMSACMLRDVLPKKPYPELLALFERVAAESGDWYASGICVRLAMQLRGQATEMDLAASRRFPSTLTTSYVIDAAAGPLRSQGLRDYEALLDSMKPRGQSDISSYCHRADESCIPKLWALFDEPGLRPEYAERRAIKNALARLKAPGIREVVLSELDLKSDVSADMRTLQMLLEDTKDSEAIEKLLQLARSVRKGYHPRPDLALAIAAIGGPSTMPYVEELLEDCREEDRLQVLLQVRGISLAQAIGELHEIGILTAAQFAGLRKLSKSRANLASKILETLESAGALYRFDAEYSGTPVPHDKLITELAALAGPECAVADVDQEGPAPGLEQDAYTVRFSLGRMHYEFTCGDQSDWYDHERVAAELNRALSEAGVEKRFILAAQDGQYPQYLFVTPAAATEAKRRGLMSISAGAHA